MKKNKMMRIASGLLVLNLMSTCAISGTFAKYVTSADVQDSARVAKWGVAVTASGHLFDSSYIDTPPTNYLGPDGSTVSPVGWSVVTTEAVVAPGTNNTEQKTNDPKDMTIAVTGTPEVAVKVDIKVHGSASESEAVKDVVLPSGTYLDYTTGNSDSDTFTMTSDYHPVKFTLTRNGSAVVTDGTLAAVETALENLTGTYAANTNLGNEIGTLVLTWKWDYEGSENYIDKADTYLGNVAAELATPDPAAGVNTTIDFAVDVAVTQVD
ncbi:MAG: hypothetical protein IIY70_05505 [Oscillospiraceae bacterium]|nr:hypothetical protein [Oscillospiraceae bacterium]